MVVVRVKNMGNLHVMVKKIKAIGLDGSGKEVFSKEVTGWYVLGGRSRPFGIEISQEECHSSKIIKVMVETEKMGVGAEFKVDRVVDKD